jgi:hypothetical protein
MNTGNEVKAQTAARRNRMQEIDGNIITIVNRDGGILVHQVNCIPVARAGLAGSIASTWPTWRRDYMSRPPKLGAAWLHHAKSQDKMCLAVIASIYGQQDIGRDKRQTHYRALEIGLQTIAAATRDLRWLGHTLYVPIGMSCKLAGGDWKIVRPMIEKYLPDAILVNYVR